MTMFRRHLRILSALFLATAILGVFPVKAEEAARPSRGATVFVPVYSHIYIGDQARPFLLAVTLCIRNTSLSVPLSVVSADYYDSDGALLKKYLAAPQIIPPLGSLRLTVAESEKHGGAGAKFLVSWRSDQPVSPPLLEAVMIGSSGQQGISFTSRGLVVKETE